MGLLQSRNRLIGGTDSDLILAAYEGHLDIVERLLAAGADVNAKDEDDNYMGATALMLAAGGMEGFSEGGHLDIVERLLAVPGIDVNAKDENDWNALMLAAREGWTAIVERLLAAGADVNAKDYAGNTALIFAADRGQTAVVKLLLEEGADVNANGSYALIDAAEGGWTDIVELLLAVPGIDVNAKENEYDGTTPLMKAADGGHTAIVELLLAAPGIDVSDMIFKDAARAGSMAIIRYRMLHDHPLRVPWGIELINEALMKAAQFGHTAIVELLLEEGADVNAKNKYGTTALIMAARFGNTAIVELLLAVPGIDVNAEDDEGNTALILAARRGHTAVVRTIERFIAEQAMNRWIPRHRGRVRDREVGFPEFVGSTRVRRRRRNSAGDVEDVEIDRLPRRAQTFIKGFL